jgi:hypothetical protein
MHCVYGRSGGFEIRNEYFGRGLSGPEGGPETLHKYSANVEVLRKQAGRFSASGDAWKQRAARRRALTPCPLSRSFLTGEGRAASAVNAKRNPTGASPAENFEPTRLRVGRFSQRERVWAV